MHAFYPSTRGHRKDRPCPFDYLRVADGTFPRQVPIGTRAVAWLESDIDTWMRSKIDPAISTPHQSKNASGQGLIYTRAPLRRSGHMAARSVPLPQRVWDRSKTHHPRRLRGYLRQISTEEFPTLPQIQYVNFRPS